MIPFCRILLKSTDSNDLYDRNSKNQHQQLHAGIDSCDSKDLPTSHFCLCCADLLRIFKNIKCNSGTQAYHTCATDLPRPLLPDVFLP